MSTLLYPSPLVLNKKALRVYKQQITTKKYKGSSRLIQVYSAAQAQPVYVSHDDENFQYLYQPISLVWTMLKTALKRTLVWSRHLLKQRGAGDYMTTISTEFPTILAAWNNMHLWNKKVSKSYRIRIISCKNWSHSTTKRSSKNNDSRCIDVSSLNQMVQCCLTKTNELN